MIPLTGIGHAGFMGWPDFTCTLMLKCTKRLARFDSCRLFSWTRRVCFASGNSGFCWADRSSSMVFSAPTDVPIAIEKKTEFSCFCSGHTDPLGSAKSIDGLPMLENTYIGGANKIRMVERTINIECLAKHCWSPGQSAQISGSAAPLHCANSPYRFDGSDQHSASGSKRLCNSIQAIPGVDWIDVQCSWRAEHGGITGGFSTGTVTGRIAVG